MTTNSSSPDGGDPSGSDFFEENPSTVFMNDMKARKREKKRRYRAKHGEIQVGLFKKWCRELRDDWGRVIDEDRRR